MSGTWNVKLTFRGTKEPLPDIDTVMPGLPNDGDVYYFTPGFMGVGDSDEWDDAITWQVDGVVYYFESFKSTALITLVPYVGN